MSVVDFLKNNADFIAGDDAVIVAAVCSSVSVFISLIHLYTHLRTYTMPQIQQWIVRIIMVCPVYAISSSVAIKLGPQNGLYVEVVRDLYEAFVVYSLLNLIMEYCGGEVDCLYNMEGEEALTMPCPLNLCMKPKTRDSKLLRFCQRGVLQFVLIKPIMATCDVITMATGTYYNRIFQAIETVIYNVSYCTALYCLLCIYLATHTQLQKFRCLWKISAVKFIILTAYYQGLAVKLAPLTAKEAFLYSCLLLSIEMILFSLLLIFVFPISEFMGGIPDRRVLQNIKDVFALNDMVEDFQHNFKRKYKDYALQRSQQEAPAVVAAKSFFASSEDHVAIEMAERYRGRSSRMAFNSLLRGTRPISGHLRQPKLSKTPSPYVLKRRLLRLGLAGNNEYGVNDDDITEDKEEEDEELGYGRIGAEADDEDDDGQAHPEERALVRSPSPRSPNSLSAAATSPANPVLGVYNPMQRTSPALAQGPTERPNALRVETGKTRQTSSTDHELDKLEAVKATLTNSLHSLHTPALPPKKVPLLAPPREAVPYSAPPVTPAESVRTVSEVSISVQTTDDAEAPACIASVQDWQTERLKADTGAPAAKLDDTADTVELFEAEFEAGNIVFASASEAGVP